MTTDRPTDSHPTHPSNDPLPGAGKPAVRGAASTEDESALESLGAAVSSAILGADEGPLAPSSPADRVHPVTRDPDPGSPAADPAVPGASQPSKPGESRQPR